MASSKIEQLIDEIIDYIDGCRFAALSNRNIVVDKEEIEGLLHELKSRTPDEIRRYQKIISNKEGIMEDARKKADDIIKQATVYTDQMVNENAIMQQAYAQASEIIEQAKQQAQQMLDAATVQSNEIQLSAMQYTDDSLGSIENILVQSINQTQDYNTQFINSLSQILNVVSANRAELHPENTFTDDGMNDEMANPAEDVESTAEPTVGTAGTEE
ncbi:vacuolar family H+-ATPase subunit H [Lachnospiraceae bacterium C1.1]|nr:vacuolar family H+-ATPase subunit H [Lachnospiraceae bacterium C1.1]